MNKNEFSKELLTRLYEAGYKYIVKDENSMLYAYKDSLEKINDIWCLFLFNDLFKDIKFEDGEPLDIAKELGVVDWSTIPKDTKVLVSNNGEDWLRRHFVEYNSGDDSYHFEVYTKGMSSWSTNKPTCRYKYCKLAEE